MPTDIHFSEPHIHTGPWAVLLWCLLIGLATVGPVLIAADLREDRHSVTWIRACTRRARTALAEVGRHVAPSHRTYKPRHRPVLPPPSPSAARVPVGDVDAPTQVLCRTDGSWRA